LTNIEVLKYNIRSSLYNAEGGDVAQEQKSAKPKSSKKRTGRKVKKTDEKKPKKVKKAVAKPMILRESEMLKKIIPPALQRPHINLRCRYCALVDGYIESEKKCRYCSAEIFEIDAI